MSKLYFHKAHIISALSAAYPNPNKYTNMTIMQTMGRLVPGSRNVFHVATTISWETASSSSMRYLTLGNKLQLSKHCFTCCIQTHWTIGDIIKSEHHIHANKSRLNLDDDPCCLSSGKWWIQFRDFILLKHLKKEVSVYTLWNPPRCCCMYFFLFIFFLLVQIY